MLSSLKYSLSSSKHTCTYHTHHTCTLTPTYSHFTHLHLSHSHCSHLLSHPRLIVFCIHACIIRSHDRKGRGYVPRDIFLKVLHAYAEGNPDVESVTDSLSVNDWVPYPKFLALFEHAPPLSTNKPPTEHTPCKEPGQVIYSII